MLDGIAEAAIAEAIKSVISVAGSTLAPKIVGRIRSKSKANKANLSAALQGHFKFVSKWCRSVDILGMPSAKRINDIYVELLLTDDPKQFRMGSPVDRRFTLSNIIDADCSLVILGDLGSGKTTSMKKIAFDLIQKQKRSKSKKIPIVIRLRDLKKGHTFLDSLRRLLSIEFDVEEYGTFEHEEYDTLENRVLSNILDNVCSFLLLDGYDELDLSIRKTFIDELSSLNSRLEATRVILTSRSGDFSRKPDGFTIYEIEHLSDDQVIRFVKLWFESVPERKKSPKEFLEALFHTPYKDLAKRPLTLANLCLIFEKYGTLPDLPISVYRKILNLLLEEWDVERGITRKSNYAYFGPQRKADFLSAFAYRLITEKGSALSFTSIELENIYGNICKRFGLPIDDAKDVVTEIESHTGIIARVSYDSYEFTHKSLQEYLVAEYISRLRDIPETIPLLRKCPNELAIAVVLSSDPTDWFCGIFRNKAFRIRPKSELLIPFLFRISIEKPSFDPTPELGSTCIWLVSRTLGSNMFTKKDAAQDLIKENAILAFISIPSIREAISAFMAYCETIPDAAGNVRILCKRAVKSKYPIVTEVELPTKYFEMLPL